MITKGDTARRDKTRHNRHNTTRNAHTRQDKIKPRNTQRRKLTLLVFDVNAPLGFAFVVHVEKWLQEHADFDEGF